ncbi:MAG: sodium:calcium antiporter [Coprococcus sp.]
MSIYANLHFIDPRFILLIKGADLFVDGSSSIARLLRIPAAVIGLTIVAFGTSPRIIRQLFIALAGQNEIAISNVLGSNIFNLMVVTGARAAISAIPVNEGVLKREFPFSIVAAALLRYSACSDWTAQYRPT